VSSSSSSPTFEYITPKKRKRSQIQVHSDDKTAESMEGLKVAKFKRTKTNSGPGKKQDSETIKESSLLAFLDNRLKDQENKDNNFHPRNQDGPRNTRFTAKQCRHGSRRKGMITLHPTSSLTLRSLGNDLSYCSIFKMIIAYVFLKKREASLLRIW